MGKDLKGKELGAGISQKIKNGHEYYVKTFYYDNRRYELSAKTLKELEQKVKQKMDLLENGITGVIPTLDGFFEGWIAYRKGTNRIKGSTINNYMMLYRKHIKPKFGSRKVDKITPKAIKLFQTELTKTLKPKSVNSITDLLHLIFESAVNDQVVKKNPVLLERVSEELTEDNKRTNNRHLSEDEQALFLSYAKDYFYYNAIRLLFATGMRSGELRGLQWKDYDENYVWKKGERGAIFIRRTASVDVNNKLTMNTPKTKSSKRPLPVNPEIIQIIEDQRKKQHELGYLTSGENYMFLSTTGKVMSRTMLKKCFENICTKIQKDHPEFERISPHACRHTFITQKLYEGANLYAVKAYVGHKMNASVTETEYTGVDVEKVADMIQMHDKASNG